MGHRFRGRRGGIVVDISILQISNIHSDGIKVLVTVG
jgi:hypothetical protein